jgi:hypothetical protein
VVSTIYVIGSLRNPCITEVGNALRGAGYDTFEDWHAGGKEADDEWQRYERERGRTYKEALRGYHALNVFNFDLYHLNRSHAAVLVMPAGRSAHLELGYIIGQGKPGYVLFDQEPERFDVMYNFATDVCFSIEELMGALKGYDQKSDVIQRQVREYRDAPWNQDI